MLADISYSMVFCTGNRHGGNLAAMYIARGSWLHSLAVNPSDGCRCVTSTALSQSNMSIFSRFHTMHISLYMVQFLEATRSADGGRRSRGAGYAN